jgi:hypothetical protein
MVFKSPTCQAKPVRSVMTGDCSRSIEVSTGATNCTGTQDTLPSNAKPASGRKVGKRVRLYSRPGNDLTYRTATRMESPSTGVLFGLAVAAFVVIAAVVLLH